MTLAISGVSDDRSMTSRLFAVLGTFTSDVEEGALTLTEIARRARLPISTTHRLVNELVRCDALDRRRDGRYSIGFRMWEIGAQTPASQMLRTSALPYLEGLHALAGDEVQLVVLDGTETVCVEILVGRLPGRASHPTRRRPAQQSAAGIVLLANAPELGPRSRVTIDGEPDAQRRRRDAEVRLEGVARLELGSSLSVAAVIRNRDREIVAAVSVAYSGEHTAARAYDDAVRSAARGISRALGFDSDRRRAS